MSNQNASLTFMIHVWLRLEFICQSDYTQRWEVFIENTAMGSEFAVCVRGLLTWDHLPLQFTQPCSLSTKTSPFFSQRCSLLAQVEVMLL